MAELKAAALRKALSKAREVGRIEESVTISGCELVFQNLTPDDYESIVADTTDLDDVEYIHTYQIGHVCRAICEIDGVDFRGVEYIEDEVQDPKNPSQLVLRKIERHAWIRDNIITTWTREAIMVAWRKITELIATADEKAKEGVEFLIPEEDSETKLRRILNEIAEVEEDLPAELLEKVLSEAGYVKKTSLQELEAATKRVDGLAKLENQDQVVVPPVSQSQPQQVQPVESPPQPAQPVLSSPPVEQQASPPVQPQKLPLPTGPKVSRPLPTGDPREMMRNRQPLNQGAVPSQIPTPTAAPMAHAAPQPAAPRAQVPESIRRAALQNTESVKGPQQLPVEGRSVRIAALEGNPSGVPPVEMPLIPNEVPEVRKQKGLDPRAAATIIEQPPVAGVNKHYKPPPKL